MSTISPYTGDGTTKQFDITFSYDDQDTVKVEVDGSEVPFTFINPSRIETDTAPANGAEVRLFRKTPVSVPKVDFEDGAIVRADDLDTAVKQPLYRAEELESELEDLTNRSLRTPAGDTAGLIPSAAERASKFLAFDGSGQVLVSPGTGGDDLLRGELAAPTGASAIGFQPPGTGTVERTVDEKLLDLRTLEDFGAVGYNSYGEAAAGTDSTAAIQAAIDWAYNAGASARGIKVTPNFFQCGNITMRNATTLIGSGRQVSGFVAKPGTAGIWFDSDNAQKTTLEGLVFYANGEAGITRVCSLVAGQAGTEGHIRDCWFRGAPEGHGLYVDGNVYYIRNSTFESCKFPLKMLGTMNELSGITIMQAGDGAAAPTGAIGIDISGAANVHGLHVEATSEGALPVKITGDVHISGLFMSNGAGFTFSHLVEVDNLNYLDWSLSSVQILPNPMSGTITNGIVKLTPANTYTGGTNTVAFSGTSMMKALDIHDANFAIKGQRMQSFAVRFATTGGGVLQHRIGNASDSSVAGGLNSKITGANVTLANTPTSGAAFVNGVSLIGGNNQAVFDVDDQSSVNAIHMAQVVYNNTGTTLNVWPYLVTTTVDGVQRVRLVLEFRDDTGAAFNLSTMAASKIVEAQVLAFLA